jgi:hypothetical protein
VTIEVPPFGTVAGEATTEELEADTVGAEKVTDVVWSMVTPPAVAV